MELNEYADKARSTRFEQTKGIEKGYSALGLAGESGEVADKVKKIMRGDFDLEHYPTSIERNEALAEYKMEIAKELGDVLWYVVAVADDLGVELDLVAQSNIDKLASRKERGVLNGQGDNR